MPTRETLERFIARVESNAHAEAIEEFYVADGSMGENFAPPRIGQSNLIAREGSARTSSLGAVRMRPSGAGRRLRHRGSLDFHA
jgi:hypothetical protein